jgi:hypothetical protein
VIGKGIDESSSTCKFGQVYDAESSTCTSCQYGKYANFSSTSCISCEQNTGTFWEVGYTSCKTCGENRHSSDGLCHFCPTSHPVSSRFDSSCNSVSCNFTNSVLIGSSYYVLFNNSVGISFYDAWRACRKYLEDNLILHNFLIIFQ